MRRHSLFAPVSVLVIGLIIIVLLIGTSWGYSDAQLSLAYTAQEETATADAYVSPADRDATSTAVSNINANTNANSNSNANANSNANTNRNTNANANTNASATIAPTVTTAVRTAIPTSTTAAATPIPTDTPEPSPTPLADYQCVPGVPVTIEGQGPANTGILLYFDDRIVSGGVVRANGVFSIQLTVGDEEPGVYPVVVQVRGTQQQVFNKTCFVPAITPTPAPLSRGP